MFLGRVWNREFAEDILLDDAGGPCGLWVLGVGSLSEILPSN